MENLKKCIDINFLTEYNDINLSEGVKELQIYIKALNKCFDSEQKNFVNICYYVFKVKEFFYNSKKTYYNRMLRGKSFCFFNDIMNDFGIDSTQVTRLTQCYEKYLVVENDKPKFVNDVFSGFNKSKLFELLSVPNEQILTDFKNKVLTYDMSVVSLRDYVKNYKAMQKQNKKLKEVYQEEPKEQIEVNEDEIPQTYNPKMHYDFKYFEDKSKSQLLNIVWDLQKEYERLKKEVK